jgi:hypothetical protein
MARNKRKKNKKQAIEKLDIPIQESEPHYNLENLKAFAKHMQRKINEGHKHYQVI